MEHVLKELAPRFYYARVAKDVQRSFSLSHRPAVCLW
jgi:hypothetical protein